MQRPAPSMSQRSSPRPLAPGISCCAIALPTQRSPTRDTAEGSTVQSSPTSTASRPERVRPDLTVLVDCPVEVGIERAMTRINNAEGAREERFELESLHFHQRVREGYLELAEREPDRFIVVNGAGSIEETAALITAAVLPQAARGVAACRTETSWDRKTA